MNILLLTADAARTSLALVIARGETSCALVGEILATAAALQIELREPEGSVLHSAELVAPGLDSSSGVADVLGWLNARNIRVDLVAHRIAHHAEHDHILRLVAERFSTLAGSESYQAAARGIEAVTVAAPELPQLAFFAVRPHSAVSIAQAIKAAGLHAPAGCPKKLKVRCDTCCAN